jgi:hypothetical protein
MFAHNCLLPLTNRKNITYSSLMNKLLTLLLLCITVPVFAQINFEQGYFINSQGSKTPCLIRNVAWKNNPTTFDYKLTEGAATQTGTINEVAEFSVGGYKFIKYTIDIDRSARDAGSLSSKKEPEFKKETVLLKVLVEGNATLYVYEDGNLIRYFYSGGDAAADTSQLIYKEYKVNEKLAYNNLFRGQLYDAMKSSLPADRFKSIRYTKDPLVALFLEYNKQDENASQNFSESQNKAIFNLKVTAGVAMANLSLYNFSNVSGGKDFDTEIAYRFGAEFEVILPFNNKKWSLFADPHYYSYDTSYKYTTGSGSSLISHDWSVSNKGIELPLGIRHYMYLSSKGKLFINAAYVLALPLGDNEVNHSYKNSTVTYEQPVAEVSKSTNFALGVGFSYEKYSAEIRYGFNRQLFKNYILFGADYTTLGLVLAYKVL